MAADETQALVQKIHGGSTQIVVAVTGGGSEAIAALLTVAGASRTVLEAIVPYNSEALAHWLGTQPEHFCAPWTARAMAVVALRRAQEYGTEGGRLAGVACTASLATDRPKRGAHRAYVALQTPEATVMASLDLVKDARTRMEEEHLVGRLLLNMVAEACQLSERLDLHLLPEEEVRVERLPAPPEWQLLWTGGADRVRIGPVDAEGGLPRALLPGAFNPVHNGHCQMARVGQRLLGCPVHFELSIENVEKPPLDYIEIDSRVRQFPPDRTLWLTRATTFVEKAKLFPGATFLVGADTITRIADARFYRGEPLAAGAAIEAIASRGCKFLVFGRTSEGQFRTLADLALPKRLLEICQEVPAEEFREDVSSRRLRNRSCP